MSARREGPFELPEGWAWARLDELAEIVTGTTKDSKRQADPAYVEVPYLRVANVQRGRLDLRDVATIRVSKARAHALALQPGDVLFTEGGDRDKLGRGWVWEGQIEDCIHQNHVFRARLRSSELQPKLISWYGNTFGQRWFEAAGKQTTNLASISMATLRALPVPVPPTPEQERIVVAIDQSLSHLNVGLATLRRAGRNLQRLQAAIFQTAIEGRLVQQEPDDEPAGVLLENALEARRALALGRQYREPAPPPAGLGRLPQGWVWATMEQVSTRVTVGHVGPMKHEYVDHGVPFLRSQNVRENRFEPRGLLHITQEFDDKLSKSRLQPGDLVVVRSGSVGTTCVVPESLGQANCADLVIVQRPLAIEPIYGSYYMNSLAKRYVRAGRVGVALTHFNTRSVAALPIPLPPIAEQRRIVSEVERWLSFIVALRKTIQTNINRVDVMTRSIMHSALRGTLVGQDPADEPATTFLTRLTTPERSR
jgi:type I restriction enzyme, S subunit